MVFDDPWSYRAVTSVKVFKLVEGELLVFHVPQALVGGYVVD
jgi:hypothetical protein